MLHIGKVELDNITVFAPLAGITNLPLRLIAKEAGCGLVCSEMISANGLVYQSRKTQKILESIPAEKPLSVQIFGSDPEIMASAARIVEASGADILDINFGCSVRKILKSGSGAALMRSPSQAQGVLRSVRSAVRLPLTIKIRTGWQQNGEDARVIADIAENEGVDAIAIHPRLASQAFRGCADWRVITEIKRRVSIPVIGNGDVFSAPDALKMMAETGCDAVMIGRAAIGNPWIFSQIRSLMTTGEFVEPDLASRFRMMKRYLASSVTYLGEEPACYMMRSRLTWFVKGMHHASRFRESIKHISSENQALELIERYQDSLKISDRQAK
jgi:tRNA-dihydrouridine synthase B